MRPTPADGPLKRHFINGKGTAARKSSYDLGGKELGADSLYYVSN